MNSSLNGQRSFNCKNDGVNNKIKNFWTCQLSIFKTLPCQKLEKQNKNTKGNL